MRGRGLLAGWIATAVVVLLGLGGAIAYTVSLHRSGTTAALQRAALARDLDTTREKMHAELVERVELLKDVRWSAERPGGADVLRRLAELAQEGQAKVSAVAPVEKDSATRSREVSHRVEMTASFREIFDFATRVEHDGAILEDMVLEAVDPKSGEPTDPKGLQAQFRLTTIEPSDDARQIMRRVVAASAKTPKPILASALTLPLAVQSAETATPVRDPFRFAEAPRRLSPARFLSQPAPAAVTPPLAPVALKGIVKFPRGAVAIVNDQILSVGDMVGGARIVEIGETGIVLHEPTGGSRSVSLPEFAAAPVPRR